MTLGTFRNMARQMRLNQSETWGSTITSWKWCSASATENNTKRNDSTNRKHEESMSVTPKEHLLPAYNIQIIKVAKANNCQWVSF